MSTIRIGFSEPRPAAAYDWCFEQFGRPSSWLDAKGWRFNAGEYTIYNEKDASLFLLRWGGTVITGYDARHLVMVSYG